MPRSQGGRSGGGSDGSAAAATHSLVNCGKITGADVAIIYARLGGFANQQAIFTKQRALVSQSCPHLLRRHPQMDKTCPAVV